MRPFYKTAETKLKPSTRVEWLDQLADDIASGKAYKNLYSSEASLIEQIYGLIQSKQNTFATVESKVKDMQDRAGLTAHWKRQAQIQSQNQQTSQLPFAGFDPKIQKKIEIFVKNKIKTFRGYLPILSLQEEIIQMFAHDGVELQDVYNEKIVKWLKSLIEEEKNKYPIQQENEQLLGKHSPSQNLDDPANKDFFHSIMPNQY